MQFPLVTAVLEQQFKIDDPGRGGKEGGEVREVGRGEGGREGERGGGREGMIYRYEAGR